MRAHILGLLIVGCFLLGFQRRAESDVAETIIAMERAALDRWAKGDPQGFFEIMASDQTYFDPRRRETNRRPGGPEAVHCAFHRRDQNRASRNDRSEDPAKRGH